MDSPFVDRNNWYVDSTSFANLDVPDLKRCDAAVKMPKWRAVAITVAVVCSIVVFLVMILVNVAVQQQPGCKAAVQPPAHTFMIVWPILFACVAVAVGFAAYDCAIPPAAPIPILLLLGLFLLTALLCSWTFVDQSNRKSGTYLIAGTLFVVLFLIVGFLGYSRTKVPALLLTPLMAWLSFALIMAAQTVESCTAP